MTYPADYTHNGRARVNRAIKAERLATAIGDLGHVPTEPERRELLHTAGVARASDETWAMAIAIYRERQPASGP